MESPTSGPATPGTTSPSGPIASPAISGPALARALSVSIAGPALGLDALIGQLAAGQPLAGAQLSALRGLLAQVQAIRMRSQQIARLAEPFVELTPERIALNTVVIDRLLQSGVPWRSKVSNIHQQRLEPIEVMADAKLLPILLESAFAWTAGLGEQLTVKLEATHWPRHAVLTVRALGNAQDLTGHDHPQADNLSWQLLMLTADAMGVVLRRQLTPQYAQLSLVFPGTLPASEGVSLLDIEATGAQSWRPDGGGLSRNREPVVLVTDDARAQRHVRETCRRLNLELRAFANIKEVNQDVTLAPPSVLIVDSLLHDNAFDQLRAQLARDGESIPTVEIGFSQSGFEISSWHPHSLSRINRELIESQLELVLSLELEL